MKQQTAMSQFDSATVDQQVDLAVLTLYGLPASLLLLGAVLGSFAGNLLFGGPVFWSALTGCGLYAISFWLLRKLTSKTDST